MRQIISIHAPRTGSDEGGRFRRACPQFQSTLPARGATDVVVPLYVATANFNPRSPHGERLPVNGVCFVDFHGDFNPRSPHGERRRRVPGCTTRRSDFNPRSPHGERPSDGVECINSPSISIHAPRTGSDGIRIYVLNSRVKFQSTLPARGATSGWRRHWTGRRYFNPRSPHGERPKVTGKGQVYFVFQSTLPARGATTFPSLLIFPSAGFQSTLPARGATLK